MVTNDPGCVRSWDACVRRAEQEEGRKGEGDDTTCECLYGSVHSGGLTSCRVEPALARLFHQSVSPPHHFFFFFFFFFFLYFDSLPVGRPSLSSS